jgi:SAM-dependent methyltransferase
MERNAMTDGHALSRDEIDAWLHLSSPRVRFVKTLPYGASVLDLGAGDGSLALFKGWLPPHRPDLRLYGVSLQDGIHTALYDGWENKNFERDEPFSGRSFDAVFCSHFVEHIEGGPGRLMPWIASRLVPQGRVYIETPSVFSKTGPRRATLRAAGYMVSTTNFYDDATHKDTVDLESLRNSFERSGFFVDESGYWRNPFLEPILANSSDHANGEFHATAAVWMATRFAQYAVGVKDDATNPSWCLPLPR